MLHNLTDPYLPAPRQQYVLKHRSVRRQSGCHSFDTEYGIFDIAQVTRYRFFFIHKGSQQ